LPRCRCRCSYVAVCRSVRLPLIVAMRYRDYAPLPAVAVAVGAVCVTVVRVYRILRVWVHVLCRSALPRLDACTFAVPRWEVEAVAFVTALLPVVRSCRLRCSRTRALGTFWCVRCRLRAVAILPVVGLRLPFVAHRIADSFTTPAARRAFCVCHLPLRILPHAVCAILESVAVRCVALGAVCRCVMVVLRAARCSFVARYVRCCHRLLRCRALPFTFLRSVLRCRCVTRDLRCRYFAAVFVATFCVLLRLFARLFTVYGIAGFYVYALYCRLPAYAYVWFTTFLYTVHRSGRSARSAPAALSPAPRLPLLPVSYVTARLPPLPFARSVRAGYGLQFTPALPFGFSPRCSAGWMILLLRRYVGVRFALPRVLRVTLRYRYVTRCVLVQTLIATLRTCICVTTLRTCDRSPFVTLLPRYTTPSRTAFALYAHGRCILNSFYGDR